MSVPAWSIRELLPEDAALWVPLRLEALEKHPRAFGSGAEEFRRESLERTTARFRDARADGGFTLGGFVDGRLMGSIGFRRETRPKERHKGDIWGVYVAPEARGSGLAPALLSETIARARAVPGLEQIRLTVAASSTAARRLYMSAGFAPYGVEPRALKVGNDYEDEELLLLRL